MISPSAAARIATFAAGVLGAAAPAFAQQAPPPVPAPSAAPAVPAVPSPSPSPSGAPGPASTARRPGVSTSTDLRLTFIGQNTSGPGRFGPEAPGFIGGAPLAPNTPYDLFSSAPQVSGDAGIGQIVTTGDVATRAFDVRLTAGLATVRGSVTNAAYWGETLFPTLDPHLGSQALPYAIAFPAHPGEDDATATRLSILAGGIATADGDLRVRGGWFDLAQSDRFVFVQPPLTSVNPAIAFAPAESLTNGLPTLPGWQPDATALPLHGIDVVAKRDTATLELTSAALPALPGESARISMASLVFDRGEGTRLSAQVLHAQTAGTPFLTTVPFGIDPAFTASPQGVLPTSFLSGQRQTIAGVRAAFHAVPALRLDAVAEIGRAWYDAAPAAIPGTAAPGGFYHAGLSEARGRVTASLDWYRMEPRYATLILPYGIPENQWSVAFAWPGQWLKSNYQLIDTSVLGVNRQGYRARYFVDRGPFEFHLEYTDVRQIDAETVASAQRAGFVDGYFLPQAVGAQTFGRQRRSSLWTAWHPAFGDVSLDIVDDTEYRPFLATHPEDRVSYEVPQAVVTFSRAISPNVRGAVGIGRYAIKGAFAEPLDFAQRLFFAGVEIEQTPRSLLLVTFRRSAFGGISTEPLVPGAPDFTTTGVIVEQRLHV